MNLGRNRNGQGFQQSRLEKGDTAKCRLFYAQNQRPDYVY